MIGWLTRWWTRSGGDRAVDALIAVKGARQIYTGFNPALRERRAYERGLAEKAKARGHRIDAGESVAQLRQVK